MSIYEQIEEVCLEYLDEGCSEKDCTMCRHWCDCKLVGYKDIIVKLEVNCLINTEDD